MHFAVHDGCARTMSAFAGLPDDIVRSPSQSPSWVRAWGACAARDMIAAQVLVDGTPALTLGLEVVDEGPVRLARFPGASHANGNFAAIRPNAAQRLAGHALDELVAAIRRTRPDIDLLLLERQAPELDGVSNPLSRLSHTPSPNVALAVNLADGFEPLMTRRRLKNLRRQVNQFARAGGAQVLVARSDGEVDRLLDAFFAFKACRLGRLGIANVFAGNAVQSFLRTLFKDAIRREPHAFRLTGLEVAGRLRAVDGLSSTRRRLIAEFGAIADDELSNLSPGGYLDLENIRSACEGRFDLYDFSVGDEPYKRQWCTVETRHFDTAITLTPKGRLFGWRWRAVTAATHYVKNNPGLWQTARRLRAHLWGARGSVGALAGHLPLVF